MLMVAKCRRIGFRYELTLLGWVIYMLGSGPNYVRERGLEG